MASVIGNMRQRIGHGFQHAVARLMAMFVIDALEMVDVAKGDAQLFAIGAGGDMLAGKARFEGAAVGQAGQVVVVGTLAGLIQAAAQAFLASLRAISCSSARVRSSMARAMSSRSSIGGPGGMAQIVDMGGQRLMIIGGGAFGVGCGGAEFVDVGFHALHQAVHGLVLVLLAQPRGILQPGLGQRATVLHALVDGAQQMLAAARQVIDRHRQGEAVDLQIVEHDEMGDVGQLLAPCGLARGVGRAGLLHPACFRRRYCHAGQAS
jgi:hypothetical protein